MSFWDSSAVIPLIVSEPSSPHLMRIMESDGEPVVWWATQVEAASALCRLARESSLDPDQLNASLERLDALRAFWSEVAPSQRLAESARALLRVHSLGGADALQLAAARASAIPNPASLPFVCLDKRLRDAAAREGFPLLPSSIDS